MNTFINKNERFLRICCNVARFFGLLLLAFVAFILIPITLLGLLGNGSFALNSIKFEPFIRAILGLIFPAFFLLGIEQLIKCLIVSDFKSNWILRYADKIIYMYAGFLIINFVYSSMYTRKMIHASGYDVSFVSKTLILSSIITFIKILVWIGIALLLKKIVPIIQESKTLI